MSPMRRFTTALSIAVLGATASAGAAQAAAKLTLTPASAPPGTPVSVAGTGYGAHEAVDVTLDSGPDQTAVTNGTGAFSENLPVPSNVRPGTHAVTGIGRTSAAVAGATLKITTPWAQEGFDGRRQNNNLYENEITQGNVGNLDVAWRAGLPGVDGRSTATPAVVSGGKVFVGTASGYSAVAGTLNAYKVGCGTTGATCSPVWTASIPGGVLYSPAVLGAYVYVTTANGVLEAFKTACATGGATCTPAWTASAHAYFGSPAVAASPARIYVGSYASGDNSLYAFNPTCATKTCAPAWKATLASGATSSPSVVSGTVYIATDNGTLEAFSDAQCAKATCAPLWTQTHSQYGLWGNLPVTNGRIFAFGGDGTDGFSDTCASSPCGPQWTTGNPGTYGFDANVGLATADGYVYALDRKLGTLRRVSQSCGTGGATCTSTVMGQGTGNGDDRSTPTIAGNVLYADLGDGQLSAFAPDCNTASGPCAPLWQTTEPNGDSFRTTPVVSDGTLYVTSFAASVSGGSPRLYAYTVGGVAAGTTP